MGILLHDYSNAKKGDMVLFHHNAAAPENKTDIPPLREGDSVYSIEEHLAWFKLATGGQIVPIGTSALCERIKKPTRLKKSKIIEIEGSEIHDIYYATQVKILKCPPLKNLPYKDGQKVYILKFSDYEVNFSHNGKDATAIKVDNEHIIAVDNG